MIRPPPTIYWTLLCMAVFLLTVWSQSVAQRSGCREGWLLFEDMCFFISGHKVSRAEAQRGCQELGATLALVSSKQSNMFIWSFLATASCQNLHPNISQCDSWAKSEQCERHPAWMSVYCQSSCYRCAMGCADKYDEDWCSFWKSKGQCQESEFVKENCALTCGCKKNPEEEGFWVDAHLVSVPWVKDYPSEFRQKYRHCTRMDLNSGRWMISQCDLVASGYVCASRTNPRLQHVLPMNVKGCASKGVGHADKCFTALPWSDRIAWPVRGQECNEALKHEIKRDSRLAILPDNHTVGFVASMLPNAYAPYWIGLSSTVDGRHSWINGKPLTFQSWVPDHEFKSQRSCVAMKHGGDLLSWNDFDCQERKPLLCEYHRWVNNSDLACPSGWSSYKGSCHKSFTDSVDYEQAKGACESRGAYLPVIHDSETNQFISLISDGETWLGLTFNSDKQVYTWADGKTFVEEGQGGNNTCSFCSWAPGEPDHSGACVSMSQEFWKDESCSDVAHPYVCSISSYRCKHPGWEYYNGYCYRVFSQKAFAGETWFKAQDECTQYGGDLASIWSSEEMHFLKTKMESNYKYWIGFNSFLNGSNSWSDGSVVAIDFSLKPNDKRNTTDSELNTFHCFKCDRISQYWRKSPCTDDYGYICKTLEGHERPTEVSKIRNIPTFTPPRPGQNTTLPTVIVNNHTSQNPFLETSTKPSSSRLRDRGQRDKPLKIIAFISFITLSSFMSFISAVIMYMKIFS